MESNKRGAKPRIIEVMKAQCKLYPRSKKVKAVEEFSSVKPRASSPPPPPPPSVTTTEEEDQGVTSRPLTSEGENASSCGSAMSVRTTASGAVKRGRGDIRRRTKFPRTKNPREIAISSEEEENDALVLLVKRKEDAPITTDKGVKIGARRMAEKDLETLYAQIRAEETIAQGGYDPVEYKKF